MGVRNGKWGAAFSQPAKIELSNWKKLKNEIFDFHKTRPLNESEAWYIDT
jgi:hypothetical protein